MKTDVDRVFLFLVIELFVIFQTKNQGHDFKVFWLTSKSGNITQITKCPLGACTMEACVPINPQDVP